MKEIGVATAGQGSFAAAGAAGLTQLLTDAGVTMDGVRVVDGSGLTTEDQLTCRTLVDTLTRRRPARWCGRACAVAGQTGTLADRFGGTAGGGASGPRPARCATPPRWPARSSRCRAGPCHVRLRRQRARPRLGHLRGGRARRAGRHPPDATPRVVRPGRPWRRCRPG